MGSLSVVTIHKDGIDWRSFHRAQVIDHMHVGGSIGVSILGIFQGSNIHGNILADAMASSR